MNSIFLLFYISLYILVFAACLRKTDAKIVTLNLYLIFSLSVSFFLASRNVYEIHDAVVYMSYFDEYSGFNSIFTGSYAWKGDYFFFFLGYLFKFISSDSEIYMRAFYFLNTFLYFVVAGLILNKCKVYNYAFFFIFILVSSSFLFLYGNVIRQGLAFSLFLVFVLIYSNDSPNFKLVRCVFCVFFALFAFYSHKAIVILVVAVLFYPLLSRYSKVLLLSVGLVASVVLANYYELLLSFMGGGLLHKFMVYKEAVGASDVTFKFALTFALLGVCTFLFQCEHMKKNNSAKVKLMECLYFAGAMNFFVGVLTVPFGKIATRFLLYTDCIMVILLPILIISLYSFNKKPFGVNFYCLCFFICLLLIPYSFLFFNHAGIVSVLGLAVVPALF